MPFSIVFSCWKTTLNLLEVMLENAEIPYARIDGATSTIERNRIVKQFQENPDTKLLLMTTGTGAVGYEKSPLTHLIVIRLTVQSQSHRSDPCPPPRASMEPGHRSASSWSSRAPRPETYRHHYSIRDG